MISLPGLHLAKLGEALLLLGVSGLMVYYPGVLSVAPRKRQQRFIPTGTIAKQSKVFITTNATDWGLIWFLAGRGRTVCAAVVMSAAGSLLILEVGRCRMPGEMSAKTQFMT